MYLLALLLSFSQVAAHKILIPMDLSQTDHLKAYGVAYWALEHGSTVEWLLNYRGGSFLTEERDDIKRICLIRGVSYEVVDASRVAEIYATVESSNMEVVRLEKAPSIAVFVPPTAEPWDDAVRMALEYAEIPYTTLWVREVLEGQLENYDWLHLHHEDFTGQYGKFYAMYHNTPWYRERQRYYEETARSLGFHKVSEMLKAVAFKIREYVQKGGFLFAMCSATDTIDIALAAAKTDICDTVYDGDPPDPSAQEKLDFSLTFAFEDFHIILDPYRYEFSDIDVQPYRGIGSGPEGDAFTLFDFSAKYDPVPTMLVQNHTQIVKGFLGQTSAFHKRFLKKSVIVLGQVEGTDEVKYIHGNYGKGFWTFYGGHDPEDYRHLIGDPPTNLELHKNSPGYRLILNNVLFPAAKKKKLKT